MTSPLKSDLFTDNKPMSLSVKDWIIRKLAPKMLLSEKTIEAVVNHQFQEANQALRKNKSLEISGFGKFFFNEGRAKKQMAKYESQQELFGRMLQDETLTEQRRKSLELKLQIAKDAMRDLKPKMYDFTDLRGMEEQSSAPTETEGSDKQDEQAEIENM
jgi:nucleoid DNA-binding protein